MRSTSQSNVPHPFISSESTLTHCVHCGEECQETRVSPEALPFCCAGCMSVYEILRSSGMCEYYDLDQAAGVSQRGPRRERLLYDVLDDPETAARYTDYSDGQITRVRLLIPGMHCTSCVWLLEQLQRLDPGIVSSRVDLLRKTVQVEFNIAETNLKKIVILLSSVGYEPLLGQEGRQRGLQEQRVKATRSLYLRLGLAGFAAGNAMMIGLATYVAGSNGLGPALSFMFAALSIGLCVPVYFYAAAPWLTSAISSIRNRSINLDVPVALGITTLFVRSIIEIATAGGEGFLDSFAGLVFFLLIGKLFQQRSFDAVSFDRSVRSYFPLSVRRESRGSIDVIPIDALRAGDMMFVRNGEIVPSDSVLMSEIGYVDYSFVTGESVPVECTSGSMLYAGGKVVGGALRLTATRPASQSYLASLWEQTASRTPRSSYLNFSDQFGRWFTVGTISVALVAAIFWMPDVHSSLNVFTAVLIIACPCALTLAAPITYGTAMGALGKIGIYIKNIGVLRELQRVTTVVFDKTGTVTTSTNDVSFEGRALTKHEEDAIRAVAAHSTHPISRSIAQRASPVGVVDHVVEEVGQGITGRYFCLEVAIGSALFIQRITSQDINSVDGTYVAIGGRIVGRYVIRSHVRDGMKAMVEAIRKQGLETILLSGDTGRDAEVLADMFEPAKMKFHSTPQEKVNRIEQLQRKKSHVLMVGDGLNDVSAMAMANVSIAVTTDTSTLAPASDLVLTSARLVDLPALLTYSNTLNRLIWATLLCTMVYNVAGLTLAVSGILTPVSTAILMPASSLLVIGISVFGAKVLSRRIS